MAQRLEVIQAYFSSGILNVPKKSHFRDAEKGLTIRVGTIWSIVADIYIFKERQEDFLY